MGPRPDRPRVAAPAAGRGCDGIVSAAGGDRGAARDGAQLGADRLGGDLRGLRPAAGDRRFTGGPRQPRAGDRVPRRVPPRVLPHSTMWPTIRGWRGRALCRRSAPICCAGQAAPARRSPGTKRRCGPTAPNRPAHFCAAASPSAPFNTPSRRKSPQNPRSAGAFASARARKAGRRGSAGSRRRPDRRSATTRRSTPRARLHSCPRAATPGWPAAGH